uniref:EB domain-containing protein n=1 Tax=Loa loa TaxID=7209 RepID=A0A1I7V7L3_LOALO
MKHENIRMPFSSLSIYLCLEQSVFTLPPQKILNQSKDMLRKLSNHSIISLTRVTVHTNRCESNDDCKGGSYCFSNRCVCPFNMIMKSGLCQGMFPISHKKVDRIGRRCTSNHECMMRNAVCHNGICICLPGHDISGSTECVPRAVPFFETYPRAIVPTITTTVIAISNNIAENSNIGEMITNEMVDPGIEVEPNKTSFDSTMLTVLPLIDAGIERIPRSRQTEVIVNISGGVCNETTLCLFFSVCRNGVCKCPLGTRISDTECKFMVDVSRLRQFEKLLHGSYSLLTPTERSTLPVNSQTTGLLPSTTAIQSISSVKVITTPTNRVWSTGEVWPTTQPQIEPKIVTSMGSSFLFYLSFNLIWRHLEEDNVLIVNSNFASVAYQTLIYLATSHSGAYYDNGKAYCTNGLRCIENRCSDVMLEFDVKHPGNALLGLNAPTRYFNAPKVKCQFIYIEERYIKHIIQRTKGMRNESSPGMPCTNGEICTGFSKCIRGMCTCPPGRNNIVDNKCAKTLRGENRGENTDCIVDPTICRDGTYCLKGFCVCPTGHICASTQISAHQLKYSKDYVPLEHVQMVNAGGPCDENNIRIQCSGNSICASGFCTCLSGERIIDGICTSINSQGAPGEVCEVSYTKCTGGSTCIDNYCKCISNQTIFGQQ